MPLLETIKSDLVSALKNKEEKKVSALRMLLSAVKNEEISKRPTPLEESDIIIVIGREIKKLKDGLLQFRAGLREDLASQYEEEIKILEKYLPARLNEENLRKMIKEKLAALPEKSFALAMKEVMKELKGKAEGEEIARIVKEEMGK